MTQPDTIEIRRLSVNTRIGVPDEERAEIQTLFVTVRMVSSQGFVALADDVLRTVDYYAVACQIQALAAAKPRRLIETLATDIVEMLFENHPLRRVDITVEKHILPDTECVAVHLTRER